MIILLAILLAAAFVFVREYFFIPVGGARHAEMRADSSAPLVLAQTGTNVPAVAGDPGNFIKNGLEPNAATSTPSTVPSTITEIKSNFVFWVSFSILLALAIALLLIGFVARRDQ